MAWIATTNAQTYNVQGWTPYGSLTLQNLTINDAGALNINGSLNMTGTAKTRGSLEFRWKNNSDGTSTYSNAIKTNRDWLEIDSTTSIKKGITIEGEATVKNKLKVQSTSDSEIRVDKICDQSGSISSCKTVSTLWQGWGGGDYWKLNGSILQTSGWNYGLEIQWNLNVKNSSIVITDGLNNSGSITMDTYWLNIKWNNDQNINIIQNQDNRYIKINDNGIDIKWSTTIYSPMTIKDTTKINKTIWETALEVTGNVKLHRNNSWDRYISYDQRWAFQVHDWMRVTWWMVVAEGNLKLQSWAKLIIDDIAGYNGYNLEINGVNGHTAKMKVEWTIEWTHGEFDTMDINDGNLDIYSYPFSNLDVTNWWQDQYTRNLSAIQLKPKEPTQSNYYRYNEDMGWWTSWNGPTLNSYIKCNLNNEWTITYARTYWTTHTRSYWQFRWCVCTINYHSSSSDTPNKYWCEWKEITTYYFTDNANNWPDIPNN